MFVFGGLAISFVIGLFCFVSSFSYFANSTIGNNNGSNIAFGIGYLLIGGLLVLLAIAGIVFLVISILKKKDFKFPIPSVAVLACAAVMFLGYDIMVMVADGKTISALAKNIGEASGKYDSYYIMRILTALLDIFTNLAVTFIVAALGVLSLITFKKKKVEAAQ